MGRKRFLGDRSVPDQPPASFDPETLILPPTHGAYRAYVERALGRYKVPEERREDIAQEILAAAAMRRHEYDPTQGMVRQWLSGFVKHAAFSYFRTCKRRPGDLAGVPLMELPSSGLTPEQGVHAGDVLDRLCEALRAPLREPFRLRAEGHTHEQIAAKTGLTVANVQYRLKQASRALGEARVSLDEDGDGAPDVRVCVAPWLLAGLANDISPDDAYGVVAGEGPPGNGFQWPLGPVPLPPPGRLFALKCAAAGLVLLAAGIAAVVSWPSSVGKGSAHAARAEAVPALATAAARAPEPPALPSRALTAKATMKPPVARETAAIAAGADDQAASRLLALASAAMQNGSPAKALSLAREHRRRFPMQNAAERAKLATEAQAALATLGP